MESWGRGVGAGSGRGVGGAGGCKGQVRTLALVGKGAGLGDCAAAFARTLSVFVWRK